jgi:hypothetical protein
MYSLASILMHSEAVPEVAREALRVASIAPPELRTAELERAASVLYNHTDLECRDVRELVGLEAGNCF